MKSEATKEIGTLLRTVLIVALMILEVQMVYADPTGPTVTNIKNSTRGAFGGSMVNASGNDTTYPYKSGGFIFTINLNAQTQNARWKAYVGNVTGSLTLDDADGYSVYDWTLTSAVSGQVYATRTSSTPNWGIVNCSTRVNITNEEIAVNHTQNPNDNISTTFKNQNNRQFFVANRKIPASSCYTTNIYENDSAPSNGDWQEVLLHDGTNQIYTSLIQHNNYGYRKTNETYDFEMILPEMGTAGWSSSTAYYFYVELT